VFDPFSAVGYVDQFLAGSADPFFNDLDFGGMVAEPTVNGSGFASFTQALLLDPSLVSGRARGANLLRRPFIEGAIAGGFVAGDDAGDDGWTATRGDAGLHGRAVPVSFYGQFNGRAAEDFREGAYSSGGTDADIEFTLEDEDFSGTGFIGARPHAV
jgi:hypothetical protein